MYTVADFGRMVACAPRTDAYAAAIARTVRPGDVVIDIGAGTGILSLLAARAGARKVIAVDPNPAIWLLPELAAENGLADRIEIRQSTSLELALPERANVAVADLRGSYPVTGSHLAALRDARERLLVPGGVILPLRDRLHVAALAETPLHRALVTGARAFERYGLTAAAVARSVLQTPTNDALATIEPGDLATGDACWATLEYGTTSGTIEGSAELTALRTGAAAGLALWFEAEVLEGLRFASAPGSDLVYRRGYLPFERPLALEAGDRLTVTLRVDEHGDRWAWDTVHASASGARKATLRQASFLGMPTSPDALLRSSGQHRPRTSPRGRRLARILALMDGGRTVREIAALLGEEWPELRASDLLDEVRDAAAQAD